MQTEKISGYFDVRKYDKKVARTDRKLIGADENISFCASFRIDELPAIFLVNGVPDEFVKLYASKDEVRIAEAEKRQPVADKASIKFKIGSGCRWFDKYGRAVTKPSNEELDGNQYEVQIDFRRKSKNPADEKAASGYWVNAIMYRKRELNPFAGQAFEECPEVAPEIDNNNDDDIQTPF